MLISLPRFICTSQVYFIDYFAINVNKTRIRAIICKSQNLCTNSRVTVPARMTVPDNYISRPFVSAGI